MTISTVLQYLQQSINYFTSSKLISEKIQELESTLFEKTIQRKFCLGKDKSLSHCNKVSIKKNLNTFYLKYQSIADKIISKKENILYLNDKTNISNEELLKILRDSDENLKIIEIASLPIEDETLKFIATKFKSLKILNISGCRLLTKDGCDYFAENCTTLKALNISKFKDSSSFNHILETNLNLEVLQITESFLLPSLLDSLSKNQNLKVFNAQLGSSEIDDTTFINFVNCHPNLEVLNLLYWNNITDASLQAIGQNLTNLKTIKIGFSSNFTVYGVLSLTANTSFLETCVIRERIEFNDDSFNSLLSAWKNLKRLTLYGLERVSESSLNTIPEKCKDLEVLSLGICSNDIQDNTWSNLLNNLNKLKNFKLSYCNLSGEFLKNISKENFYLSFESCKISAETWDNFNNPNLSLNSLYFYQTEITQTQQNIGLFDFIKANSANLKRFIWISPSFSMPISDDQLSQLEFPRLKAFQYVEMNDLNGNFSQATVASVIKNCPLTSFVFDSSAIGQELAETLQKKPLNYLDICFDESWPTNETEGLQWEGKIKNATFRNTQENAAQFFTDFVAQNPIQTLLLANNTLSSESLTNGILQFPFQTTIYINGSNLNDSGLSQIASKSETIALQELDIFYSPQISQNAIDFIKKERPEITVDYVSS
ncbi:MAG: hypothetical protein Q8K60_04840 [Parachlamydiaceae bacterium]|nr:hypothetical protein [Parachlamydiaceae bacterium]